MILFGLLVFPAGAQDTNDDGNSEVITGTAYITEAEVTVSDDEVRPVVATIQGELQDSCTTISDVTQTRNNRVFTITVETARPRDAFCAQMTEAFTIDVALDVAGLAPGEYALLADNTSDVFFLPEAATVPQTGVPTQASCLAPDETTGLFLNPEAGYCLLYPESYEAEIIDPTSAFISHTDPAISPATSLLIQTEAAGERTLDTIGQQIQQETTGVTITFDEIVIGGERALVTEDIDARVPSRFAYVLHDNTLYTFTLQPVDATFADATAAAEALWEQVVESFQFISIEAATAQNVPSAQNCPTAEDTFEVYTGDNYCFRYPDDFLLIEPQGTAIVLSEEEATDREQLASLTINVAPNRGLSLARLADNLQTTYPDTDLNPTDTQINGEDALQFTLPGRGIPIQETYVLWGDNLYTFSLQPVDADQFPQATEAAQRVWQTVRDSVVFFVDE
jgi:hypothetical protein